MGLDVGNVYEEVNTLFTTVYRIYEQRHNEVYILLLYYKFIIISIANSLKFLFFFSFQARVASSAPAPSNPSTSGRSTLSRIKSIIRRSTDSPLASSSHPTQTSTEIQLYSASSTDYANINLDDENFNVLQYWHNVKGVFPILAAMAHDFFAVPVSTVSSESCFSAANRILTDKRTRLGPNVFEAMVLLKDWWDAEQRVQDKSWMHAIENEQAAGPSNPNPEVTQAQEVTQSAEVQVSDPYASNPYMSYYEEYGYNMYNQYYDH